MVPLVVLPDLALDSGRKLVVVLSVLLRPESPPLLGRPMRLWASIDVLVVGGGSLDDGRIVILE